MPSPSDRLGQIEVRIVALERRITTQTLLVERLRATGGNSRLAQEMRSTYQGLLAVYYDQRALALQRPLQAQAASATGKCR